MKQAPSSRSLCRFVWDGIHPNLSGHALMLRTWREAVGI